MNSDELIQHLCCQQAPIDSLEYLGSQILPKVIERLNEQGTRRHFAIYGGDQIPQNERNLTDVRNRMSLLIEYEIAVIGNELLRENGIDDVFWTYVIANRFPDIEIRNNLGHRGTRLEIKCLESIAEEKSANFDTLKKDLNPNTDYVAVFIWE